MITERIQAIKRKFETQSIEFKNNNNVNASGVNGSSSAKEGEMVEENVDSTARVRFLEQYSEINLDDTSPGASASGDAGHLKASGAEEERKMNDVDAERNSMARMRKSSEDLQLVRAHIFHTCFLFYGF